MHCFLVFVDHHPQVYPLQMKDEVFEQLVHWKVLVEKPSGKKLKTFKTDNGGEFTSTQKTFISPKEFDMSEPYQRRLNKMVWQRYLTELMLKCLLDAKLSKKYWAESVSTAVYLRNRCPSKAVTGKMPYEAWFGQKPNVDHLRVFGYEAYVYIPKVKHRKLQRNVSF